MLDCSKFHESCFVVVQITGYDLITGKKVETSLLAPGLSLVLEKFNRNWGPFPVLSGKCSLLARPVSSVGRAPDFCAGGLGFEPRPDQHSGS